MEIKKNFQSTVRADSLFVGDVVVDSEGTVFTIIDSNEYNLIVKTKRSGFLPAVLVLNMETSALGWLKRAEQVTLVKAELSTSPLKS